MVLPQAGLVLGTVIIFASNIVTLITALSMCAISTNGEVKGGGACSVQVCVCVCVCFLLIY